jgi:hypothetical protein
VKKLFLSCLLSILIDTAYGLSFDIRGNIQGEHYNEHVDLDENGARRLSGESTKLLLTYEQRSLRVRIVYNDGSTGVFNLPLKESQASLKKSEKKFYFLSAKNFKIV